MYNKSKNFLAHTNFPFEIGLLFFNYIAILNIGFIILILLVLFIVCNIFNLTSNFLKSSRCFKPECNSWCGFLNQF